MVLDEVQSIPDLFAPCARKIHEAADLAGFLLLGSASGHLLRQQSESLAGRVLPELPPLLASEMPSGLAQLQQLWLRGGFPAEPAGPERRTLFHLAARLHSNLLAARLADVGRGLPAETLHRFWRMSPTCTGIFNASHSGVSLGGTAHTTVTRYLDLLVDTMMTRRLEPHLANVGKRLVKSPKVYIRDSGLVHALLNVANSDDLQGHPIAGASWEGFCVEQISAHLPPGAQMGFYRTAAGAEIDVVVSIGQRLIGLEIKFSSAPKLTKGFWIAREDLKLDRAFVMAPVEAGYPLADGVEVIPVHAVRDALTA